MWEQRDVEIDLYISKDTTHSGDGAVVYGDPLPFAAGSGILAAILIGVILLYFRRTWELHENVLHTTTRASLRETQKMIGSAAYTLGERAQRIVEQSSDEKTKTVMMEAHEALRIFGARRTVQRIEIPKMIGDIVGIYRRIPRPSPIKEGEKTQRFLNCLSIFADLVHDITGNLDEQRAIDSHMSRCTEAARRAHTTVSEETIIKTIEKNYLRLLEAKDRYVAAGPRPKKVKRADTDPPPKASPLTELLFVIEDTTVAVQTLPAQAVLQDRTQVELFRKDLGEWIELCLSLAYAKRWYPEVLAWFLVGFLGRLGTSLFVGSKK